VIDWCSLDQSKYDKGWGMDKVEVLMGWISMMAWMCKGMEIDMSVKVDMMEVGMRLNVDMRLMEWICKF